MCQRFQTWRARALADSFGRPRTVDAGKCQGEQDPRIYGFVRASRTGQKFGCGSTLVIDAVQINRLGASDGRLRSPALAALLPGLLVSYRPLAFRGARSP